MKKTETVNGWSDHPLKKTVLIMRIIVFLLLASIFQTHANDAYAQRTKLSLNFNNTELELVLDAIENQSEFFFLYNEKLIDVQRKVSVKANDQAITEILNGLFDGTDVQYSIVDRKIVLAPEDIAGVLQQQRGVSGKVTDRAGMPLPGVTVVIKGTMQGTITDTNGNYALNNVSDNSSLIFSFVGMRTLEVIVGSQSNINVTLVEETIGIEEVVAIGYGSQKVKELTGSVSQVSIESMEKIGSASFTSALQGQVAGVNVMARSGAPGETSNIQIRGIGSFSSDALNPLFVVDGIPFDGVPNFGSNEIESINILKDAASASIYGTRASNGVILITTKRGKEGQMRVSLDGYYGITDVRRNIPVINNTLDWLYVNRVRYLAEAPNYHGWTALVDNPRGLHFNTNWFDHFQKDNAPIQNYNIQLSGGKEGLEYNMVNSYFEQKGMWINSEYKRISSRGNVRFSKGKFTANAGTYLSYDFRQMNNTNLPLDAIRLRPFKAPIDQYSDRIPAPGSNSAAIVNIARRMKEERTEKGNSASINMDVNYSPFEGFNMKLNVGGSLNQGYYKLYEPAFELYNETTGATVSGSRPNAELTNRQNYRQSWITEFVTNYEKTFNNHNLSAVVAFSFEQMQREYYQAHVRTFLSNDIQVLSGGSTDHAVAGTKNVSALFGSLGRVQYNYAYKYLLSASVRRDGSSKFGEKYRYGIFPSFSAGWILSEENFYSNSELKRTLSYFKIRASYGTAGNQFISDYLFAALINSGENYSTGSSDQNAVMGATQFAFANKNVKWETSVSQNLGIDINLWDGRLSFTGDMYFDNKKDMLFPMTLPPSVGTGSSGSVIMNIGNMTNKGIELSSTYKYSNQDLKFSVTGIFMKNVNEVTKTNLSSSVIWGGGGNTVIKEGYPVGTFFLIPNDGIIKTKEEEAEYKKLVPGGQMGDIKYVDYNNDKVINDNDRIAMGSGNPDWEAGVHLNMDWKYFDLSIQTYGAYGNMIYNDIKRYTYSHKRHMDNLNSWSPANPTSNIPTPKGNLNHDNYRTRTDYYLEDGSYFRIRNVQLGYNIPNELLRKLAVQKCRIYVSVENPLTFTKYSGNDPEVGGDGLLSKGFDSGNIPVTSQYRFGFQLNF